MYERVTDLAGICKTPAVFWVCVKGRGGSTVPVRRGSTNEFTGAQVYRRDEQMFFCLNNCLFEIPDGEHGFIQGDVDINLTAMGCEHEVEYIKYTNLATDHEWIADYAKRKGLSELEAAREVWEFRKSIHGKDMYDGVVCGWDVIRGEKVHMDESFVVRFSEQGEKMQVNGATIIKDWYHETYPTDPCWEDMHGENNFLDLYNCLNDGEEVYDCLFNGTGMDSLVRERCFQQLAELMHCEYGVVYDQWLHGAEIRKERIAEAVRNCTAILNRDGCGHAYCKREKVWTSCEKLGYCALDCGGPYSEEE